MTQNFTQGLIFGGQVQFDPSNMSAFGTLETAELTPVMQGDFVYGTNTQIWSTANYTGTGALVDTNASRLRIQCGTSATSYAYITTRRIIRYRAGEGTVIRLTPLFSSGTANNIQLWGIGSISNNLPQEGYYFGYNGTSFGIAHYNRGTGTWTAQNSWNGDRCLSGDGSFVFNPTLGTPAMIKYPYLGYGNIEFFLQNPDTARWVLAHVIKYANTSPVTQLANPSLQILGYTANSGNTTNRTMYCGSYAAFISGMRSFIGNPKWAADSAGLVTPGTGIKVVGTTETCLLNLRNCTTYNGNPNRGMLRINSISVGNGSVGNNIIIRLLIGATFTTTPVYTPINGSTVDNGATITGGNSIASVDVAGTTITSLANRGSFIFNVSVGANGSQIIDLTPFEIYVAPGEILTVSGQGTAGTNTTASLNWTEDI